MRLYNLSFLLLLAPCLDARPTFANSTRAIQEEHQATSNPQNETRLHRAFHIPCLPVSSLLTRFCGVRGSSRSQQNVVAAQALQIPLILEAIFCELKQDEPKEANRNLLSCCLVNSLWDDEARRVIWQECGNPSYSTVRLNQGEPLDDPRWRDKWAQPFPQLEHLERLATDRQQKYANCIQELTVDSVCWAKHTISCLNGLSFPRLKSLILSDPYAEREHHKLLPIDRLIQRRLKKLKLAPSAGQAVPISQDFLSQLQQDCPGLRELSICPTYSWRDNVERPELSQDEMVPFLQTFDSLERFCWEVNGTMSQASFDVLSTLPKLQDMSLLLIDDSWVNDLPDSAFQNLQTLCCAISGPALSAYIPYIQFIVNLDLTDAKGAPSIWQTINKTRLYNLESLKLSIHASTDIHGDEIAALGPCFPQLRRLELTQEGPDRKIWGFTVEAYNDQVIEKLARLLPKLEFICLCCHGSELLTESSIISLGRHCPSLQECHLYSDVNWKRLAETPKVPLWSNLKWFYTVPCGLLYRRRDLYPPLNPKDKWTKKLIECMPALQCPYRISRKLG